MESMLSRPTEAQISQTLADVRKRLSEPAMQQPGRGTAQNKPVLTGYLEVEDILIEDRRTYDGIDNLRYQQSRAIAVLGVDYLLGECTKEVLMGVPLKPVSK